ncbi:MAG: hypothetical protein V4594_21800 [Bacteroidota bacterium]
MTSIKKTVWLVLVVIVAVTSGVPAKAQTFAEWFSQKKTQKKYLLNQIAALQVYIGYARKGYEVASSGLGMVRDISRGEFNLHSAFITGLKQVSPAIRNDARIAEIIALQVSILKAFGSVRKDEVFSADQLAYIAEVSAGISSECYHDLEELLLVITSGKLEMSDDERLSRLNGIYERMLDKSAFTQSFCGDAAILIRQKEMEQDAVNKLRRYYEIE